MKRIILSAACLFAAQGSVAQVQMINDTPVVAAPTTLRHMSGAAGESRTFIVDVPAGSHEFTLVTEGGSGLLGVTAVGPASAPPCEATPTVRRGLICGLGWSSPEQRRYAVTLAAAPEEGFEDVTIRIGHGRRVALNGVAYGDIDASTQGGTGGGFIFDLDQPGSLSVGTWGGSGDLHLQLVHHDGSFGGRMVCDAQAPGTWQTCHLAQADAGRYRIDLLGTFRDINLRASWD